MFKLAMALPRKRILFTTNSEYGQANVLLAVIYELVHRGCDVHVASFTPLRSRVDELSCYFAALNLKGVGCVTFHVIPGSSMVDKWRQEHINMFHRPGVIGTIGAYFNIARVMAPWSVEEYAKGYRFCVDLGIRLNPDLTVVDSLFSQGLDAASKLHMKYVIINAISHSTIVSLDQPITDVLFHTP
jgi:hypothetical protein